MDDPSQGGGALEAEYGSVGNVVFWEPELISDDGGVIKIPCCDKCGKLMQMVIGKEAYGFICTEC